MAVPSVKLNNGRSIPILGLGTWGVSVKFVIYSRSIEVLYR